MEWHESDGVRWLRAELPSAVAAFTTRLGGESQPPFDELNVGIRTGDDPSTVLANRRRLADALGRDPAGFLIGRQVHGANLASRERAPDPNPYTDAAAPAPAEADAQLTATRGLTAFVQVADCVPVALAGADRVGAVHCGWRGLAAGIVERAVGATGAKAAAIGPAIGPCCYEVGPEVLAAFAGMGKGVARGSNLDLGEVTRRQLARAGVTAVVSSGLCTSCESDLFFSHRRDGERSGRQAGIVWRADDA